MGTAAERRRDDLGQATTGCNHCENHCDFSSALRMAIDQRGLSVPLRARSVSVPLRSRSFGVSLRSRFGPPREEPYRSGFFQRSIGFCTPVGRNGNSIFFPSPAEAYAA